MLNECVKESTNSTESKKWIHNPSYLRNAARQEVSYYYEHVGSRI